MPIQEIGYHERSCKRGQKPGQKQLLQTQIDDVCDYGVSTACEEERPPEDFGFRLWVEEFPGSSLPFLAARSPGIVL